MSEANFCDRMDCVRLEVKDGFCDAHLFADRGIKFSDFEHLESKLKIAVEALEEIELSLHTEHVDDKFSSCIHCISKEALAKIKSKTDGGV